jgi:coiled-coil domain-containing protein 55
MQSKDGTIVGQKGVKYGLQKPVTKGLAPPSSKSRPINIFGDDSDEEDVGVQVMRQADKKRAAAKVQAVYETALADDPSVFDYDGVYDTMQQQKLQPKQQEKLERKSRYIAQLKDQAEERKREADIAYERKMLKVLKNLWHQCLDYS